MKRSFALTIAGALSLAVAAVPAAASAQETTDPSIAEIAESAGFTTLLAAAGVAGLDGALADCDAEPITVFAPTNDAFAAALTALDLTAEELLADQGLVSRILQYHVVPGEVPSGDVLAATSLPTLLGPTIAVDGGAATLNGTVNIVVESIDLQACNGIVHVIDGVLLPPSIATVATDAGFGTLVTALGAANLAETFADCLAGPFTVFAPTDQAFADALAALGLTLEQLAGNTELLTTVLQYHVVEGVVPASEVLESTELNTLAGEPISVAGAVLNGSVNITDTDIFACNGVIHVIDAVLLPPSLTPEEPAPTTTVPATTVPISPELPATGTENVVMVVIASFLVLAGAALVATRRRSTV